MNVTARTSTAKGKGCAILFLAVFALAGFLALFGIGKIVYEGTRSRFWESVPATVLKSDLRQEHGDYILDVEYHYSFGGQAFTGTRLKPGGNKFDGNAEARRAQQFYRSDMVVPCLVNSSAPAESYLQKASPWEPLLLIIPAILISIGVGGIVMMRRAERPRAISEKHRPGGGTIGLRIFGSVFLLVGGAFLYGIGVGPWLEARSAESWPEVPCKITLSHVDSHRGSKGGTSYSLEILYEYTIGGHLYSSDRFDFSPNSSGPKKWRQQAAAAYPVGRQTVCYVNPEDPTDAVLVRQSGVGWVVLIPLVFFLIGLAIVVNAGRLAGGSRASGLPSSVKTASPSGSVGGLRGIVGDSGGPVELTRSTSVVGAFIGLLIVALIWNGLVWGVLLFAQPPTAAKVFLSIFALVGLGLFAAAVHQFLAIFNPQPTVHASTSAVRLGDSMEIRFSFSGKVQRIASMSIVLKAEEVATYRRGTNSVTDRHVFLENKLLETADHALMRTGAVMVTIPGDLMHSFDAPNNKVQWMLTLHGSVPRWPDVQVSFPINVLPHRQESVTP